MHHRPLHQRFQLQTFTTRTGLKLRYREQGEGPPMILIHGAGTDHVIWRHQILHFGLTHRVLALDLPGAGLSDRPDEPYTLDLYASVLEEFISTLGLERPILVGNCTGAATALVYAFRYPGHLAALVLFHVFEGTTASPSLELAPLVKSKFSLPFFLWGRTPEREDFIYRHHLDITLRHPLLQQTRKNTHLGLESFNRLAADWIQPAEFPPTLLFWGARNRILPAHQGRTLAQRLLPDAHYEVPDAGHLAMAEHPGFVNIALREFLAQDRVVERQATQAAPGLAGLPRPRLRLVKEK